MPLLNIALHTRTHTHTKRERERERERALYWHPIILFMFSFLASGEKPKAEECHIDQQHQDTSLLQNVDS